MAARNDSAARLLLRAAVFPCLGAWLLVRLWVPLGGYLPGKILGPAALALAGLLIFLWVRLGLMEQFLPTPGRCSFLIGGAAFVLGTCLDISYAMLDADGLLIARLPFRLLCHLGSGLLTALLALALLRGLAELKGIARVDRRQIFLLFAALNLLTALYVCTSRTVYVWDNAGYWSVARSLSQSPLGYAQLRTVLESTIDQDYNYLLAFPISLIMRVFGGSRAVFLFSIANLYVLPGLWAMAALLREKRWGGLLPAALFPMFPYIGLVGYVDVAAASLALWAYVVYHSDRPEAARGVVTGALLVGAFLLRRYFIFFAASFGLAALVDKLVFDRRRWRDFAVLFASCAFCALLFTYRFLLDKVLGTNYGDLYSAYGLGLKSDALLLCRYFGLVPLLLLLLATLLQLFRREGRREVLFPLIQAGAGALVFLTVQSHGQQHLLLYLPALAFLASRTALPAAPKPSALLAGLTFFNCLLPKAQPASIGEIARPDLLPSFVFYGPQRTDIDELLSLRQYVDSLSAEEPHTAVVLASSFLLNDETLSNLYASLNLPEPETRTTIQYHGTVDKRDAFNWNTATADYLIIGDPVQVHLGEENQQVMVLLAQAVLDGVGPGEAYALLPDTFTLSDGSTVRIYRQIRPWTAEDYFYLSDILTARYPDYAALYTVPEWVG